MLVIVLHNNADYLKYLAHLARKEGIKEFTFVKRRSIGTCLLGGDASLFFSRGSRIEAYERAFIAIVGGEQKAERFLDLIADDEYLERINMQDKGFICSIPFLPVMNLKLESSSGKEKTAMTTADFFKVGNKASAGGFLQ